MPAQTKPARPPKPRNYAATEATLINIRALKARVQKLELTVARLVLAEHVAPVLADPSAFAQALAHLKRQFTRD